MCGLGEMQRSYSPTRRNTLCTSRPSTIRGDAWARKNTQRQYHDRNFRNQLRSQNQRCLQLSAAACSACCFDSKSIAARRAKNTSTNQSCLQQPYHCIFSHPKGVFILRPSRWPGTCAQPCGPLYRLRSMLSMFQRNIMKYPLHSFELSASIFIKFFVVWTYGLGNSYSYLGFSLEPTKGGVNLYSQCI